VIETIPRGPFTSIGRFHMVVPCFFPLPLIVQKNTYIN